MGPAEAPVRIAAEAQQRQRGVVSRPPRTGDPVPPPFLCRPSLAVMRTHATTSLDGRRYLICAASDAVSALGELRAADKRLVCHMLVCLLRIPNSSHAIIMWNPFVWLAGIEKLNNP